MDDLADATDGSSGAIVGDDVAAAISSSDIEGAPETQKHTRNTQQQQSMCESIVVAPKPNPRRSRSFDDLLETDVATVASIAAAAAAAGDHSQSVECLSDGNSSAECPRDTESITVHNSRSMSPSQMAADGNSSSSTLSGETAGGTSSRLQQQPQPQRTLLNRYVKKVKSFIRK